jgi:tRNA(adenine34) deaminase
VPESLPRLAGDAFEIQRLPLATEGSQSLRIDASRPLHGLAHRVAENRCEQRVLFWRGTMEATTEDLDFMRMALAEAQQAAELGEVPVGAIIVAEGRVVARAGNRTITDCDPTAHAEILAVRDAAKNYGNHRLLGATLYATIEPCAMCAGALVQARIARLVYGADDPKGGAVRSCFSIFEHPQINHRLEIRAGVLAEDSVALLRDFFAARR